MKLTFLGATDTVTGSKYLVQAKGLRILVDCGLYQGVKALRDRNWKPLEVDAKNLDAVILTHAHIDHSGYLPALMKQGFKGPIYCSAGTKELCNILLPDAGFLQEEDANFANKHKFSKHAVAKPLYTEKDARQVLTQIKKVSINHFETIGKTKKKSVTFMLTEVGHILGACAVHIDDGERRLVFSGDIGRYRDLMLHDPKPIKRADVMVVESTYGDRLHKIENTEKILENIIKETAARGGTVLIPAFAVGRAQLILYHISRLKLAGRIPSVPVYLNSPMAISATEVYKRFNQGHKLSAQDCEQIDDMTHYVRTAQESIALNEKTFPAVIISASGMASGGRVLHHMKGLLGNYRNSLVFVGYQAAGTRGQAIVNGAQEVKIHGQYFPVKAQVHNLSGLSAHGDYQEILNWLGHLEQAPDQVYVTHGERCAADCMRMHIKDKLIWPVRVPELGEEVEI